MLPFLLERILDEMPAWLYNNNMIKFLIPTAKEMKPSKEVPSQKLSEKSEAILTEMAKLSTDDLSIAYKIKPEQAEKEKQRWDAILAGEAKNYPAVELFNGLMYRYIKRKDLSTCEKDFLSHQVFITSSFYGIIPAFYPIQEHRRLAGWHLRCHRTFP